METFRIANADPEDIAKRLGDALPHGTLVIADRRTSSLIVSGKPELIARTGELIASLDRAPGLRDASIPMRYVKASEALKALQATVPVVSPASAYASDQQNALVLVGPSDFIAQILAR